MTNLPFLLQTTNFLSQSICTNIPSHQSPGARPNFHYLCKTDCKMKQKLTTANLGHCDSPGGREGREGGMGAGGMSTLGRNQGLVGEKMFTRKSRGTEKKKSVGGRKKKGKSPKESLRNAQRKKFRMSREKGTIEKWLRCKKSAQNCSVEKGEARRNTEITQIEREWPQQNPEGFRDESTREIFSLQWNNWRGLRRESLEDIGDGNRHREQHQERCAVIQVHPRHPVHLQTLHGNSQSSGQAQTLGLPQICPDLLQGWGQHCCKPQILDYELHTHIHPQLWLRLCHPKDGGTHPKCEFWGSFMLKSWKGEQREGAEMVTVSAPMLKKCFHWENKESKQEKGFKGVSKKDGDRVFK